MAKTIFAIFIVLVLTIGLLAWAPWLSPEGAQVQAARSFETAWEGIIDGCGFNCDNCGAGEPTKTWFGYTLDLEYACGMLPADLPEFHQHARVFVSSLGTVHGIPRP